MKEENVFRGNLPRDHRFIGPGREEHVYAWLAALPWVTVRTTDNGIRRFTVTEDEEATIEETETNEETDALKWSLLYLANDVADEERSIWVGKAVQGVVLEDGMQLECMSLIAFLEGLDYVVFERSLPELTKQGNVESIKVDVKEARARLATLKSQDVEKSRASLATFKGRKQAS